MRYFFLIFTVFILNSKAIAQNNEKPARAFFLGINYGQSTQSVFPFNNSNYQYENQFFKLQVNHFLGTKKNFRFELHIEPGIYFSNHQLLNIDFITEEDGPDYLEQREIFTKKRSFREYVLNIGIIARYEIMNNISSYFLASVGPMVSDQGTERLKKGFAFSDIGGIGFSYNPGDMMFDLRLTFRHNSNANLASPNHGHNSVGLESGISFPLK